ncbi:CalU12 protein [Mycolicibacterium flavescens]|uniref:DUF899 domain-containing protein n=1 Tax=Mycobacterium neumannii TaxID=2048551 RepID=UPI000B9409A6|nr:DUF899 domain-containing protein [Mycobacterium neumannii]VEG41447.1 CalU12 protein [Mycolicibacterium flavescens]
MKTRPIVPPAEWDSAWQEMLVKEKELMRARDALAAQRRRMPWMAVDKNYTFEGPEGRVNLLDLFDGRRQLIVYRAFIEPGTSNGDWPEHGCVGCSLMADHVPHLAHLNARDTTFVYASRASQPDLEAMKNKMGWRHPWYTILPTKDAVFDVDFGVHDWHGTNVFIRDDENRIYRTYFINERGDEVFVNTWNLLDVTPLGRQEDWEDSPEGCPQDPPYEWWRWHDTYDQRTP